MKKLLFVVNVDWFFILHRLPIALAAQSEGYKVHIAATISDGFKPLSSHGFTVHPICVDRKSAGLGRNIKLFYQLLRLFHRLKPDVVHLVTIKPVTIGGIAARLAGVKAVVAAISGLGYVFVGHSWKNTILKIFVVFAYRLALGKHNLRVIFENSEDRDVLLRLTKIPFGKAVVSHGGVGVDLSIFRPAPLPSGTPLVLMASRLLADKGVREYVEAAKFLRQSGCEARFCLAGAPDPGNPESIEDHELKGWIAQNAIEYWGYRSDMPTALSCASVVVLPSYREGLPRILVEAAACGRAIIATDVPGCRQVVRHGSNGLLVPPRNALALADAMRQLILDRFLCERMGKRGREIAEAEFSVEKVVEQTLSVYRELVP